MWKYLSNLLQYCFCFTFRFSGRETYGILASQSGIEPSPPALEGKVFTAGLLGKSHACRLERAFSKVDQLAGLRRQRGKARHSMQVRGQILSVLKILIFSSLLIFFINFDFKNIPLKHCVSWLLSFATKANGSLASLSPWPGDTLVRRRALVSDRWRFEGVSPTL